LSEHREDMRRAAEWVAAALRRAGAPHAAVHSTEGNPIVIGGWPPAFADEPTVLVYGHYDVQPADPIDEWETPPFEPEVRGDRLYGRGASDNKGTLLIPILACEALTATHGRPPIGVTFLIEGDEEIASPHLRAFLEEHREELAADAIVSADSVMWAHDEPSLILGCKGLVNVEISVSSASTDLHSGLFGGIVPNAALVLTHLLASMVSPSGEITIEGFEDGIRELTVRNGRSPQLDLEAKLAAHGVNGGWGEPDFEPLMRNWHRPTVDLNGFHSGFGGEGPKAIIPAEARAKVSCRLVPGQTPEGVFAAIERHVARHAPPEVHVRVARRPGGAEAFSIEPDDPVLEAAGDALERIYGHPPLETWLGATLPFASLADEVLGVKTVMLGWGMPDENAHAPDEFIRLQNLDRGVAVYAELLALLASGRVRPGLRSG
jgi:acetylornithine deacetylase/succinyl-diaminopimelate desuccinylase-like protein